MTVAPSCPALVIHDDDSFRRSLIAVLDQKHFTVTYMADGADALRERAFEVILLSLDLNRRRGLHSAEYLRDHRQSIDGGVLLLADPNPELRTYTPLADETLLKPVDPSYVADRARVYCRH